MLGVFSSSLFKVFGLFPSGLFQACFSLLLRLYCLQSCISTDYRPPPPPAGNSILNLPSTVLEACPPLSLCFHAAGWQWTAGRPGCPAGQPHRTRRPECCSSASSLHSLWARFLPLLPSSSKAELHIIKLSPHRPVRTPAVQLYPKATIGLPGSPEDLTEHAGWPPSPLYPHL